ncbi:MAG TPA: hypothetical protein VHW24_23450 [Bryobacteraceae bacterium]|jgi:hypothetical protein|nr:hypothetical protein [Bryobacteraceae bacterium]
MSHRLDFEVVCPNNHNQTITFSPEEFEEKLKSDTLVLHCNTCDTNWTLPKKDIASIRERFAKEAE